MAKQAWKVSVIRDYLVYAQTIEEARKKGLEANIGQTEDFEFGGMLIETMKISDKLNINGHRGEHSNQAEASKLVRKLAEFDAKYAVKVFKAEVKTHTERALISWAREVGHSDDEIDQMVDAFLDEEWDWDAPKKGWVSKKAEPKKRSSTNALTSLKEDTNGSTERGNRSSGEEHEYINFGKADGV